MAEQPEDRLDYQSILKDALRDAVRRVLARVAEHGLPGEHYFYVAFRTDHPGVEAPGFLRERYPDEMTVVLQHQFWDLEVTPEAFSVRLTFNAARHVLRIPFAALTAFIDPSADFALRFEGSTAAGAAAEAPAGGRELEEPGAGAGAGVGEIPVRPAAKAAGQTSRRTEPAAQRGSARRKAGTRGVEGVRTRGPKAVESPPPPDLQPEKDPPAGGKSGDIIRFDPSRRR